MAYGIAGAASGLARLVRGQGAAQGRTRLALVLRVENVEMLRASIGPAVLERMLDRLMLRLVGNCGFCRRAAALAVAKSWG